MLAKNQRVKTGLDVLHDEQFARLRGARVAVLGHPASINHRVEHLYDLLVKHDIRIVRLFGPEHGFFGSAQDMESVGDSKLTSNGIPVLSLYGENRKSLALDPSLLKDVDILVCDLQDIGSRYYTFVYTVAFALTACAAAHVKCIVLDRPNPINGSNVAGNIVKPQFASFVGEYPLANQHGLTIGELAHYFKKQDGLDLDLEVIWMKNWRRGQYFDETGLPWVMPSPNMPHVDTALLYPGLCLIEGTNLSEGRGTTRPFELIGAPYIDDPDRFAKIATQCGLEGVMLRACWFKPMFQKHAHRMCGGVQIHIIDRSIMDPMKVAIALMTSAQLFEGFDWRREPYEFVHDRLAIDLLFGDDQPRLLIEDRKSPDQICSFLRNDLGSFMKTRSLLLHDGYEE